MLKLFTNIDNVKHEWRDIKLPKFLSFDFLQIYYKKHPQIKHLFIIDTNLRLYGQIFKLTFNKTKNYLINRSFVNFFLKFISFDVLYLTNSFITNVPSFISKHPINFDHLLNIINHNYSIIVIPDFLFENIKVSDSDYIKIEVEEEMILDINTKWLGLEDYILDLRKKYRKKVKKIIKETSDLQIRDLDVDNLESYTSEMQQLFNQVVKSSRFRGPEFNVSAFSFFVKKNLMKVDGYFLNGELVGFSSYIEEDNILYSYFVGFDKKLNQRLPIYGRILVENISHSINLKKKRLILGRTANEYKSNFGAFPIKSYVYLKVKRRFLRFLLTPIFHNLGVKKWKKRSPFKRTSLLK